jgi:hypothetical protein
VAKVDFTYEVRKLPTDPVWIEDYVVRTRDGESVGTVGGVLERDGERLLIVQRGVVPLAQEQRVVPWGLVDRIDHGALGVWLSVDEHDFEERALELDPDRAVEEGPAEARRLTEPPDDLIPSSETSPSGPVDRPLPMVAVGLLGVGAFLLLVVVLVITLSEALWPAVFFVVPGALLVAAAVLGYRSYRSPYEPYGAQKP